MTHLGYIFSNGRLIVISPVANGANFEISQPKIRHVTIRCSLQLHYPHHEETSSKLFVNVHARGISARSLTFAYMRICIFQIGSAKICDQKFFSVNNHFCESFTKFEGNKLRSHSLRQKSDFFRPNLSRPLKKNRNGFGGELRFLREMTFTPVFAQKVRSKRCQRIEA